MSRGRKVYELLCLRVCLSEIKVQICEYKILPKAKLLSCL